MTVYRNSLGARLVDLRESRNLKQREVAAFLGITSQAYSQYEHDKRCPDLMTTARLAQYFDVSMKFLATGDPLYTASFDRYLKEDLSFLPEPAVEELRCFYDYLRYKYKLTS